MKQWPQQGRSQIRSTLKDIVFVILSVGDMFQRTNIFHLVIKKEEPETGHFFWINTKSIQKLDIKRLSTVRKITKLTFWAWALRQSENESFTSLKFCFHCLLSVSEGGEQPNIMEKINEPALNANLLIWSDDLCSFHLNNFWFSWLNPHIWLFLRREKRHTRTPCCCCCCCCQCKKTLFVETWRNNSCYYSWARRQNFFCLQLHANEAKGSIQWEMASFACQDRW